MGMKKLIRSAAVVALMSLVVASCNKQAPKVEEKSASTNTANAGMHILRCIQLCLNINSAKNIL